MISLHRSLYGIVLGCFLFHNPPVSASETVIYEYDALGRLIGSLYSGGMNSGMKTTIEFDRSGNRTNYNMASYSGSNVASLGAVYMITPVLASLNGTRKVVLTSGTSWTVPSNWHAPWSIEAIGGGGGGKSNATRNTAGAAGGGGAWAKITNADTTINAGQTLYLSVGTAGTGGNPTSNQGTSGGNTWLNKVRNSAPTSKTEGVLAARGLPSPAMSYTGGSGGAASSSIGSSTRSGGVGGAGAGGAYGGAGGGGAGGNLGAGGNGASASGPVGAAGGTSNGSNSGAGGAGGNGGTATGTGGVNGAVYGGGGGGGGAGSSANGDGGNGAQGVIIITYSAL